MTTKKLKLAEAEIKVLGYGYCLATDHITVEGMKVGYMYREEPDRPEDSGWRFFSGEETPEFIHDTRNSDVHEVNTIANCDPDIIPYLDAPAGSAFGKDGETFLPE